MTFSTRHSPHGRRPRSGGLLSIVIPCHDEENGITTTHRRLVEVLPQTGMDFEIIYVDDGSHDGTLAKLERIVLDDPRATVIELSRNFGQQAAMSAGLAESRGDAVVLIDADLQDPPEVIPEMVQRWRDGAYVAYGRRRSRDGETAVKLLTASLFHRFFAWLLPYSIPVDTGDFKLLDRVVVDAVCRLPEKRRYLRSLVAWTGFRQEAVWYDRKPRTTGVTKYSFRKLVGLAADAVLISSDAPLRAAWMAAGLLATTGLIAAVAAFVSTSLSAAIMAIVGIVAAVQVAATCIVGEYAVRAYREAQGRPTWVTRRLVTAADLEEKKTPLDADGSTRTTNQAA